MKIKENIHISKKASSDQLQKIIEYANQINVATVSQLQIMVRHCLGDMMSTLDYLAYQIFEENCTSTKKIKVYFPLHCLNQNAFKSSIGRSLPDLDTKNPTIYSKLEQMQFYHNPNEKEWMRDLRIEVNENKHTKFSEQHKEESEIAYIGTKSSPSAFAIDSSLRGVIIENCSVDGVPTGNMVVDKGTVFAKNPDNLDSRIQITKIKTGEFYFTKLNKPIIQTLTKILQGIESVIREFED